LDSTSSKGAIQAEINRIKAMDAAPGAQQEAKAARLAHLEDLLSMATETGGFQRS
jgi:hypothetical protein